VTKVTERTLAWRQLVITLAMMGVFFLFPSWLPEDLARPVSIAVKVVVYTLGVVILFRYWKR
jgi:hypothetical protein